MPRAQRSPEAPEFSQASRPSDWQDLRSELADLLERVENRFAPRASQVVRQEQADPEERNRDALRSVRRAIDRFSDRGPVPDSLQDAIREIRTRQTEQPASAVRIPGPQPLDELLRAVGSIGSRLERLEGDLKAQQGAKADTGEIAEQVTALARVVDMLSRSVGETGHMQRLETQVASLAASMAETPRIDLSGLGNRLNEMSATVEKLADLQMHQIERDGKGSKETNGLKKGMASIEESVRHVYDRIDAIEKNFTLAPADIEKLTSEMAAFTRALREDSSESQALVGMVETLGNRIGEIEARGPDVAGLKADLGTLRSAVLSGMEPRFAAIEMQIEELGERMAEPARPVPGVSQIEAEVRKLVERMDQTSAQLGNLARLYAAQPEPEPMPDFGELVERTAMRTSELVTRATQVPAQPASEEMLDEIERRMTRLFKAASRDRAPEMFAGMQDGIRKVDERLERLEASLGRMSAAPAAPTPSAVSPKAHAAVDAAAMQAAESAAAPRPKARAPQPDVSAASDAMPINPSKEQPLVDKGFGDAPDMGPVRAALEAKNGPRKPAKTEAKGQYDPALAAPPPKPRSSLDATAPAGEAMQPMPLAALASSARVDDASSSTRNTFIEAARRAAQRHPGQKVAAADANSLIGRAIGRFQPGAAGEARALPGDMPTSEAPKPAVDKPAKGLPFKLGKAKAAKPGKPVGADEPAVEMADIARRLEAGEDQPGFLTRHRPVILMAATLVAVSLLTLNLIGQRMGANVAEQDAAPIAAPDASPVPDAVAPAAPAREPVGDQGAIDTAPRIIDMVDSLATAAIDKSAAAFAPSADAALPPPLAAAEELATAPATMTTVPTEGMPPEGVGPESLRKAAANGDPRAQFEVAAILTEGKIVPEDLAGAADWYRRAADQGFAPAQYRLGNLYEAGKGVSKDPQTAKAWYLKAAEAGNRMSMHNLAALYAGGALGKQDFPAAAEWFEKAATRGMTDSQFNLGMLYARGLGVPQNLEASYKWFSLAAMRGDADAGKARDDIARSLDVEAVSRLNLEIAAFQPTEINLVANFAPIGTWAADFNPGDKITTKEVVASVQAALDRLGFDIGAPDGVAGKKTADAIKAFERATGMSESGAINPRLLAVLGSQPI